MSTTQHLCTFRLADLHLGVAVTDVQEVIRYQEMTTVPLAHPVIRGLINLRGQIVTALDMRVRFGLPPREEGVLPMNVVVRGHEGVVSLLVDEIDDVIDVVGIPVEAPPPTMISADRTLLKGVFKLDRILLLELDIERAIAITTETV